MPVRATVEEMPLRPRGGKKWAIVGCVGCLVTPILVLAGYLAWASYLPPPEKETVVLPSPNGFDATVAASRKLTAVRGNSPIADPHNADPAALRQALAPDRPALDELRQAIRLDYV
ncbi:MAG TPA: hypothetical protein VK689_14250, partial [Armatimonadota bacterium]|nr:hypothetical protein [Armatimonadota bacterium]